MGKPTNLTACQQAMANRFSSLIEVLATKPADKEAFLVGVLELCLNHLASYYHGNIVLFGEVEGTRRTLQYTLEPKSEEVTKKASTAGTFKK